MNRNSSHNKLPQNHDNFYILSLRGLEYLRHTRIKLTPLNYSLERPVKLFFNRSEKQITIPVQISCTKTFHYKDKTLKIYLLSPS